MAACYNLPSHHLHHKFVLNFSSHCLLQLTFECLHHKFIKRYGGVCRSLQLTFTLPPSLVCLGFTYILLFTANTFTLRLKKINFVTYALPIPNTPWQCISLLHTVTLLSSKASSYCAPHYNSPSHWLHLVHFDATPHYNLPWRCFHHKFVKRYGIVSLYNLPSHRLHHKLVVSLPPHCFSQQTPSRCALKEFNCLPSHCPHQKRPEIASHKHIP